MRDPDEGGGVQCEGLVQVRGDEAVAVALLLDALHVAEGAAEDEFQGRGKEGGAYGRLWQVSLNKKRSTLCVSAAEPPYV